MPVKSLRICKYSKTGKKKIVVDKKLTSEEKKVLHRERAKARYHSMSTEERKERVRVSRYGKDVLKRLKQMKEDIDEIYKIVFAEAEE